MAARILFLKAYVGGYYRDGKWVEGYENHKPKGKQKSLFGGEGGGPKFSGWKSKPKPKYEPKPKPKPEGYHPQPGDNGERIPVHKLSQPTPMETWADPGAVAVAVPDGTVPASLNGVALAPWDDAPRDIEAWKHVDGQNPTLREPEMPKIPGKHPSAGVVVEEPDGRVWIVTPTNGFGGYKNTFPKGTVEDGLDLQASAIKEAFEESGLKVEIEEHLADVERSTSVTRYYRARRVGGNPADMGWESQAVALVPKDDLLDFLNSKNDHPIAQALGVKMPSKELEEEDDDGLLF